MKQYTTGELAALCGVTVRTVQYYDKREILSPFALSEGGRRLYGEEELQRLRLICFLRELGLSIDDIGGLLTEESTEDVLAKLLEERRHVLRAEIEERQQSLTDVENLQRELRNTAAMTPTAIGNVARMLKGRKKRRRMLIQMLLLGLVMDALQVAAFLAGLLWGHWWVLVPAYGMVVTLGVYISSYYFNHTAYLCPHCGELFAPRLRQALFARHTSRLRRLTCPGCGQTSFCTEVYKNE